MNPRVSRVLSAPLSLVVAVAVAVVLFVTVTSKGVLLALALGSFVAMLILSFSSAGAGIFCLILAAYFEGLYKGFSASLFTLLIKDFFLAIVFLRLMFVSQRQRRFDWVHQPFTTAAIVFVVYCGALMFAPSTRSVVLALAGFRAWVLWMPIYFPAYMYFANKQTITRFLVAVMLLQLPVCLYGIVQGNIGYAHTKVIPGFYEITKWYNVDVDVNEGRQASGGGGESFEAGFRPIMSVRACSITISPGTFGAMALLTVLLALGMLAYSPSKRIRLWSLLTALAGVGGMLASGSRAPMFGLAAGLVVMVVLTRQRVALLAGLVIVTLVSVFVLKDLTGGGAIRLQKRLSIYGAIERSMQPLNVGWQSALAHPFGNGIASGIGMGRIFYGAGLRTAEGSRFIENEFGRALSELGLVGGTIWLAMLLSLMWHCLQAIRRMGGSREASLAAGLFGVMAGIFTLLGVGSALYQAQPGMYFWVFGAAIIRLGQYRGEVPLAAVTEAAPRKRRFGYVLVPTRPEDDPPPGYWRPPVRHGYRPGRKTR